MKKFKIFFFATFVFTTLASAATENLDEMFRRKERLRNATYPIDKLEDASNHYIWQPETLMYNDKKTGHEVWRMTSTPDLRNYMHSDIGVSPWSADGKRMSIASKRDTRSFANRNMSWFVVDTNGKNFRPIFNAAGPKSDSRNGYFHWSPQIPDLFYEIGESSPNSVYKTTVSDTGVSPTKILSLPGPVKIDKMISGDGRKLLLSSWWREGSIYPVTVYPTPRVDDDGYSIDRDAAIYGTTHPSPDSVHDRYYSGDGDWYFIMPEGGGNFAWWRFKTLGSASDGGPFCDNSDYPVSDPNYNFGECWPENATKGSHRDPFGSAYWSHFVPDMWGRYALYTNVSDEAYSRGGPGPGVWDIQKHKDSVFTFNGGATHHDWHGFTDWTTSSDCGAGLCIQKYNDKNSQRSISSVHKKYNGGGSYTSLPRPGQSPDGTKVAWHSEFLNKGGDVDVYWTVAYNPYPPTNLEAKYSGGVKIKWLPPKYTERGWPYAKSNPAKDSLGWPLLDGSGREIGEPLYARELKRYHIWRSPNGSSDWREVGAVEAKYDYKYREDPDMFMLHPVDDNGYKISASNKIFFTDSPGDGTYFYAITSEEHSGLESDELSEILRVSVSGSSVTSQIVHPKGQRNFWKKPPSAPLNLSVVKQSTPGHYLLNWVEPNDSKIRYYNIYYSTSGEPEAIQQNRIASVPVGTSTYLDWLADPSRQGNYKITSVDRYGNESGKSGTSGEQPICSNFTCSKWEECRNGVQNCISPVFSPAGCVGSLKTQRSCVSDDSNGNLALGKFTKSSPSWSGSSSEKAVNGRIGEVMSHWSGKGLGWLVVDLGVNHKISVIKISPFGRTNSRYFYNSAWNVKFSTDGQNWQNFQNVKKLSGAGQIGNFGISISGGDPGHGNTSPEHQFYEFSFDQVATRFVKFEVVGGDVDGDSNLDEIEIFYLNENATSSSPRAPTAVFATVSWE